MKSIVFLLVITALAVGYEAALVKAPASRANLNVGQVSTGDRLLHRQYMNRPAIANSIQSEDLVYRGNATVRITAVQATEVGYTQYASAWILSGGLNQSNVTVRLQSYRGYGYYYLIDIWGR